MYLLHLGKARPLGLRLAYGSESVVRVLRLCLKIKHGSIGVLDSWSIGMKTDDYDVFLFLALLHYSTIPLFQKH